MNGTLKIGWSDYLSIINYFSSKASLNDRPIDSLLSEALKNYADKLPSIPYYHENRFFLFHSKNTCEFLIEEPSYSFIRKRFGLQNEEMGKALKSLALSYMGLPPSQRDSFLLEANSGKMTKKTA